MSDVVLNAEIRQNVGKRAKHVRSAEMTPGVYYGHGDKNLSIQVSSRKLAPLVFTSKANIIDLRIGDQSPRRCIIRDIQFDPVTDLPIHFDLQGLREDEQLTLDIPVVLVGGTPKGVRDGGGLLSHMLHKIEVQCLPKDIPEKIEVNVAELEINMSIHVRDISIPNVEILESEDATVVAVFPPTVEKEPTPEETATEETAEPEVVGKGKKDDEEESEEEADKKE